MGKKNKGGNQQKQGMSFGLSVPDFFDVKAVSKFAAFCVTGAVAAVVGTIGAPVVGKAIGKLSGMGHSLVGTTPDGEGDGGEGGGGADKGAIEGVHKRITGVEKKFESKLGSLQDAIAELEADDEDDDNDDGEDGDDPKSED